jgi:hypothetical protein
MALAFLTAMRRNEYPSSVCVEREYTVTYTNGVCSCDNCHKTKTIRALSRQDARHEFERKFPLAWVLAVN